MKRSVTRVVVLSFLTFGIYYLYLIYAISKEVNELTNDFRNNPLVDLLLSIFTLGLYTFYWFYKISCQIEGYEEILAMKKSSIALLTVLISVFLYTYGGPVISIAIIQNEINKVIDEKEGF